MLDDSCVMFQAGHLLIMNHHDWNRGFSVIHHGNLSMVWELCERTTFGEKGATGRQGPTVVVQPPFLTVIIIIFLGLLAARI